MPERFQQYFRCAVLPPLAAAAAIDSSVAVDARSRLAGLLGMIPDELSKQLVKEAARQLAIPDVDPGVALDAVVEDLLHEGYLDNRINSDSPIALKALVRRAYYALRPIFPVGFRKHLQKMALRGWQNIPFPSWPVDTTVEDLHAEYMRLILATNGAERIPFVWFWPRGYRSAVIMTHDVETSVGRDHTPDLIALEREVGLVSSFEIVPEVRYESPESYLATIREAGCEVCIHGLNHDGHMFDDRAEFERRVARIRPHAERMGARGFRSPVMYRHVAWLPDMGFSYDMSVPNVAHLDPQRGGCASVMPYFVGNMLELPLTTIQDYPLQNNLNDFTTCIWERQMEIIGSRFGLASFNIHPDYTREDRARRLYRELLSKLASRRDEDGWWIPLPGELEAWWRMRSRTTPVVREGGVALEGPAAGDGVVAHALLIDSELHYELPDGTILPARS